MPWAGHEPKTSGPRARYATYWTTEASLKVIADKVSHKQLLKLITTLSVTRPDTYVVCMNKILFIYF